MNASHDTTGGDLSPVNTVRIYRTVRMYASRWCHETELDVDDLVQEVVIAYVRQYFDGADVCENPSGWLSRAVRNRAISLLRSAKRRRKREQFYMHKLSPWVEASTFEADPVQRVTAMLESLKSEWREVIVLRLWEGLTFDEIAESLHQSRTTVYRRYQEVIQLLRRQYDEFII